MPQSGEMKSKVKSWEVSDLFWEKVEPLIPRPQRDASRTYQRRMGGGRKPMVESAFLHERHLQVLTVLKSATIWITDVMQSFILFLYSIFVPKLLLISANKSGFFPKNSRLFVRSSWNLW